uniref:Uncharacterized protein n=1 Tax=Oryza sativa subsp. indica TaxID=39946 RepID=A0A679BC65_ORYSI|nr:hypothetical protein [Oryza sativa Indica Group]
MEPLPERREGGRPQKTMTTQWREAILGITMDGCELQKRKGEEAPDEQIKSKKHWRKLAKKWRKGLLHRLFCRLAAALLPLRAHSPTGEGEEREASHRRPRPPRDVAGHPPPPL